MQRPQQRQERVGDDRPAHPGRGVLGDVHHVEGERPFGRGRQPRRLVVVHAQEVDGGGDDGEVLAADVCRAVHDVGVAARQHGVGEEPVHERVERVGRRLVVGGRRPCGRVVVRQADLAGVLAAQSVDGQAVGEELVVRGGQRVQHERPAGGVDAERVAVGRHDHRLVEGYPHVHAVGEPFGGQVGEFGEPVGGVTFQPAAGVLERLREVPVVEGRGRGDARGEQAVHQAVVEVEPLGVDRAAPRRLDARPRDREPVGVDAEVPHERDVLGPPVVVVAGDVAGVAVADAARRVRERVPDGRSSPVLGRRALDLVRGGGDAPAEAVRNPHPAPPPKMRIAFGC